MVLVRESKASLKEVPFSGLCGRAVCVARHTDGSRRSLP
jgi:hypothetical protein